MSTTDGVPWKLHSEEQLRDFLIARIKEGFVFPLNPVWPVRDKGWYKVNELACARNRRLKSFRFSLAVVNSASHTE